MPSQELNLLSEPQIKALVNLMKDSDQKVLSLISEQVGNFDNQSLRAINDIAKGSNDDDLIDNWYYVSRLSLGQKLKDWKKNPCLESGLLLITRLHNPAIDESIYVAMIDDYAERVRSRIKPNSTPLEISLALNQVLFREENYIGNQISYYDLNNNFLHTVMESKTGNPIMLSSIFMLVARRLGLEVQGIGTPGHFIVKYSGMLLDPFFGGREITKDECVIRAQELNVYWRDEYLDPIDDISIVARCIRNLIAIYKKQNRLEKAADASELLKLV
jgi:regulator of sirC expression with transglutaminase-like and TPR domain